ncbi:unnamed protein product [Rotaria magnacalcarata]|uniref:Uncharacterized protein n=1 Tax=Rotaria magnacalcarata TaxID=392030 RepID=A0A820CMP0_9BILA|nr:unnamed protein product [Rotaria magnacalcarata]
MNKKLKNSQYDRFIKSYVSVFKGTKEAAYAKENENWEKFKVLDDQEKIEKEIYRMTLEYKSKQPQSLFVVWARKSTANQISFTTKQSICHSQITTRNELDQTVYKLNSIRQLKATNLLSNEAENTLKLLENQQSNYEKKLKRLEQIRISQAKFRRNRKLKLKRLIEKHPNVAAEYNLALYNERGQPSVEGCGQSSLQDVIIEIASRGAAADPSRSSNLIASCMNLDELVEHLKLRDFILSRSATYLRLLPRRSNSTDGKRHVRTAPVRLKRSSTGEHKKHVDQYFAMNTINHLKTLTSMFGSDAVIF